jgi:hypothetical protein
LASATATGWAQDSGRFWSWSTTRKTSDDADLREILGRVRAHAAPEARRSAEGPLADVDSLARAVVQAGCGIEVLIREEGTRGVGGRIAVVALGDEARGQRGAEHRREGNRANEIR